MRNHYNKTIRRSRASRVEPIVKGALYNFLIEKVNDIRCEDRTDFSYLINELSDRNNFPIFYRNNEKEISEIEHILRKTKTKRQEKKLIKYLEDKKLYWENERENSVYKYPVPHIF